MIHLDEDFGNVRVTFKTKKGKAIDRDVDVYALVERFNQVLDSCGKDADLVAQLTAMAALTAEVFEVKPDDVTFAVADKFYASLIAARKGLFEEIKKNASEGPTAS